MEKVPLKNWLKRVKKYYNALRWLKENNIKGKPDIDEEFRVFLSKLTNIILLAPIDYLIVYWGIYCQGYTYASLVEIIGCSKRKLLRIHAKLEKYLEESLTLF